MSCDRTELTRNILLDLMESLYQAGYTDEEQYSQYYPNSGDTNIFIKKLDETHDFVVLFNGDDTFEIILIKYSENLMMYYRDDETQIYIREDEESDGYREFSEVRLQDDNTISYNEYFMEYGSPLTEPRREMLRRRSHPEYTYRRNQTMNFDTDLLFFDLPQFIHDECLQTYFRRNEFVVKENYGHMRNAPLFVDFELDMI